MVYSLSYTAQFCTNLMIIMALGKLVDKMGANKMAILSSVLMTLGIEWEILCYGSFFFLTEISFGIFIIEIYALYIWIFRFIKKNFKLKISYK